MYIYKQDIYIFTVNKVLPIFTIIIALIVVKLQIYKYIIIKILIFLYKSSFINILPKKKSIFQKKFYFPLVFCIYFCYTYM